MGFIEETGAAQHYRDARILPIYEGTNGIPPYCTTISRSLSIKCRCFYRDCDRRRDDFSMDVGGR